MGERIDRMLEAIEHAQRLGTFGKADRSKQYPLTTEKQIIDAVNLALTKVRMVDKEKGEQIAELKKQIESRIWHRIVMIVAAAEFTLIVMLLEKWPK